MKFRHLATIVGLVFCAYGANGQGKILTSQYFQNLPAYSPALTGVHDYLDVKAGFRKQWAGYEGAPQTSFLSAYGSFGPGYNEQRRHSLRVSDPGQYTENQPGTFLRVGFGGYILTDEVGPLKRTEGMLSGAVHVPVADRKYISLGTSVGIMASEVEMDKVMVIDPANDPVYQAYVNGGTSSTFLNINTGIGFHSDQLYVSYNIMQVASSLLSGNELVNNQGSAFRHNVLAGFRMYVTDRVELLPNVFFRAEEGVSSFFDVGMRARFNESITAGMAYRNNGTYILMMGLAITDALNFGYSYEYKTSNFDQFNNSSHEIVLGIKLFNYENYSPMW
ncbi:MAG: PorP/SprF family type IX secretion system membrane protein [Marinoscillum sp.]|uniref:PorP/SprF family type IX secretion system membrane protein n=1 Tax=Marinoscillum sp. TaxID=2024838 RepID=UPI0032F1B614